MRRSLKLNHAVSIQMSVNWARHTQIEQQQQQQQQQRRLFSISAWQTDRLL